MKLKYRGVSYQAFTSCEQVAETAQIGVYRGVPYHSTSAKVLMYQPAEELTYRGVRYVR